MFLKLTFYYVPEQKRLFQYTGFGCATPFGGNFAA